MLLKTYDALETNYTPPKDTIINLLWHSAYFFKKSGFMSDVSVDEHYGKEDFTMLLIIDLDPNDYSCLYATLVQAKLLNIRIPCVTFD